MQSVEEINKVLQPLKTNKHDVSDLINSPETESDDGFYLVEKIDFTESTHFNDFPWLAPNHPLYFPTTGANTNKTRWEAIDKFSVENWYPFLTKHTFKSRFITLNYQDILYLMGQGSSEYNSTELEKMFNTVLSEFNNKEAFMRLSTRSPKDSKYLFDEASTLMSQDSMYWRENNNKNQQLVSFVNSMLKAMKIKDAKKIIKLIQHSPRVFSDLIALVNTVVPSECRTKIILREWYDIRPDHEFRVFVSRRDRQKSIVTAVSQYFHFLYFDKTPSDCFNFLDELTKEILIANFTNYVLKTVDPNVATFLNFLSEEDEDNTTECIREYIVDLALIPANQYRGELNDENTIKIGDKTYALAVIELNPFSPAATGSGLFNWKNDLMTLWGKSVEKYPLFRYRTTPREDLNKVTLLPANYESVITAALSKRLTSTPLIISTISPKDKFFVPGPTITESTTDTKIKEKKDISCRCL